ncbi:glycosyl hydrolase family 61-domain-containing protein [Phaeosphaeria sp. MPI-PUGE-AT-0046c]|nr:glycosyl hydrolase family 61-domain-containing protein [Phaeosphaeria sp. MPI-PUGE-AT-0046c]
MFSKPLLLTTLLSASVSAHQNFHQFWINSATPGYQAGIRMPPSNSPVEDVTSPNMACNVPSTNGAAVQTVDAKAGDSVKVQWDNSGHPGPITHFLKAVDNAATDTGIGGGWFKIDELDVVGGKWASEVMQANNMTHEFKLPEGLKSGEYLLRSEMLALHSSQNLKGGQFYIGCAQLKISGSGSGTCGPTIELPGAYKAEDKNIYIPNYYNGFDLTTYKAPGGPVASCGGSSGGAAPTVPEPANSTAPSATAKPSAVVEATAKPSPSKAVGGVESPVASQAPVASSAPAPAPAPAPSTGAGGDEGTLPASFTIKTFITWLESKAGAAEKVRRHARAF